MIAGRLVCLVLVVVAAEVVTGSAHDHAEREMMNNWHSYKSRNGLAYHSLEERSRYNLFRRASLKIREHNRLYAQGKTTYTMALNKFAHMTDEEYKRSYLGYNSSVDSERRGREREQASQHNITRHLLGAEEIPAEFSYVSLNQVTPIRNQYDCGSCWSFTAAAIAEILHIRQKGTMRYFSVQQLLDCDNRINAGCMGGLPSLAFDYIKYTGLLDEGVYPYTAKDGVCRYNGNDASVFKISGHVDLPAQNERLMKKAIALYGPLAAGIAAGCDNFKYYSSGVFDGVGCGRNEQDLDHAIVIVGYGVDAASNRPYWLVRNSYGIEWGEKGYIRISRNSNTCGISILPTLAV